MIPEPIESNEEVVSPLKSNIVDAQSAALKKIAHLSEKELLQHIALYNKSILDETLKIKNNIQFFFWLTIIGIVIVFLKGGNFF